MSMSLLFQWLLGRGVLPSRNAFFGLAAVFLLATILGVLAWASTFVKRFITTKEEKRARARLGTALGWLGVTSLFFVFAWWQGVPYLGALIFVIPCVIWMVYEGWLYTKNRVLSDERRVTSRYDRWLPKRKKA